MNKLTRFDSVPYAISQSNDATLAGNYVRAFYGVHVTFVLIFTYEIFDYRYPAIPGFMR